MRHLPRFTLALFCLMFVSRLSFAQTTFTTDQKELLKEALRAAVVDQKTLPDYQLLKSKRKITLYDKMVSLDTPTLPPVYLTSEMVPHFKKVKFELLNEAGIFDPKRKKDLLFLRVAQINQPETEYGIVTVLAQMALGSESRAKGFLYKEAMSQTMLFKKTNGVWAFQKVVSTFPNLIDYKVGF